MAKNAAPRSRHAGSGQGHRNANRHPAVSNISRLRGLLHPAGPVRYVFSLAEQGSISLLNLGANLLLIRAVGPAQYGAFVIATNVTLILCNLQGALTLAHLMTLPPGPPTRLERASAERMTLAMTLPLVGCSALFATAGIAIAVRAGARIPWAVALYLPALVLYSYTRSVAFSRGRAFTGTLQSMAVLAGSAVLVGAIYATGGRLTVPSALLILALCYAAAAIVTLLLLCGPMIGTLRRADLAEFRHYARESVWCLVGIGSIEMLTRFNSIIVSAWFGTAAVGTLAASQLLLRPIGLVVSASSLIGRSGMAERREAGDWPGFVRSVTLGGVGALALSTAWSVGVFLAWPLVSRHLFQGRYADDAWIVALSGLSTILGVVLFVVSLGFQQLRRFRLVALTDLGGAALSIGATLVLLKLGFGFAMSLVGMMLGQMFDLVFLAAMLAKLLPRGKVWRMRPS